MATQFVVPEGECGMKMYDLRRVSKARLDATCFGPLGL